MITRTQITLDEETQRRARARAAQLGISFTEYVRRLVARDLREPTQAVDPSVVFNLGSSGGSNIARDKDALIRQAVAEEPNRNDVAR
jgi:hypothetical protein